MFRRVAGGFRYTQRFLGGPAGMALFRKLLLAGVHATFGGPNLLERFQQPLLSRFVFGTKLDDRLTLPPEGIHRFALGEFRVSDLGLQVPHDAMRFR
jgi:hypothetical protein